MFIKMFVFIVLIFAIVFGSGCSSQNQQAMKTQPSTTVQLAPVVPKNYDLPCESCGGKGVMQPIYSKCWECNGTGFVTISHINDDGSFTPKGKRQCKKCGGSGSYELISERACDRCKGTGKRVTTELSIKIGMTQDEVQYIKGRSPDHIKRTTTQNGTNEQWDYYGQYLYFDNGILTAIQDL